MSNEAKQGVTAILYVRQFTEMAHIQMHASFPAIAARWAAARLLNLAALVCGLSLVLTPHPVAAQANEAPSAQGEPAPVVFSQEELDQLLAPVALYPDTLLTQVLVAASCPLEVVEAERFIRVNAKLRGEALTRAAANKGWDVSVVSLLQFPSVVTMMNDQLD